VGPPLQKRSKMSDKPKIAMARALRQRETDLEHRLWQALRRRRVFGLKFRRQHPLGPYVADFACLEAQLLIEIDGYWHTQKKGADAQRDAYLRSLGYEVVRFDIENEAADVDTLAEMIAHEVKIRLGR
jgi:very-short-patch-repair endonuclease